ncbi:hypothetical protein PsorP6_013507 [Peronosclerospora sorghi]|uniref:Uncharacterized protein n=1 Tax=Peronosclerospora sorghi TaxID=230839 RepID=A0ACC0VFD7_9STRA|nr:hypothetical protein PsorP6_013507 [Peronosclerospora sorghi]
MHPHTSSRPAARHWDQDHSTFVSSRDLRKTLEPAARRSMNREPETRGIGSWPPPLETIWSPPPDERSAFSMTNERFRANMMKNRHSEGFATYELHVNHPDVYHDAEAYYEATSAREGLQVDDKFAQRPTPTPLQRSCQADVPFERHGRVHEYYYQEAADEHEEDHDALSARRKVRETSESRAPVREWTTDRSAKAVPCRQFHVLSEQIRPSPGAARRGDHVPLDMDNYAQEKARGAWMPPVYGQDASPRTEFPSRPHARRLMSKRLLDPDDFWTHDERVHARRRSSFDPPNVSRAQRGTERRDMYDHVRPIASTDYSSQSIDDRNQSPMHGQCDASEMCSSRLMPTRSIAHTWKQARPEPLSIQTRDELVPATQKVAVRRKSEATSVLSCVKQEDEETRPKRRCGRKSMNYSSEQKRERNRAAVKKCRQRQALKMEYLQQKAASLRTENHALSEMLVQNMAIAEAQRASLTRGIQMDILLKMKEIFTQSLPKDFVLDADAIWDCNSVLAVSMPSRCYYGIESIKDFWRTSLRMRNKGKIRSFWAWLFRLPPGDRFAAFEIQPFASTSNLYFVSWTTKSTPPFVGSMVMMFGNGYRVTLHVECFGWLIWRYLLTNHPFPEPND